MTKMNVVAIDGPAGAGKSVCAKRLAERLGLEFLNTGGMYRAVALLGLRQGLDLADEESLAKAASNARIEARDGRTYLDGEDVTEAIRSPEATQATRYSANAPSIRAILVKAQRAIGESRGIVTEGRDQGTAVFPDARCKIYLTASARGAASGNISRAARRSTSTRSAPRSRRGIRATRSAKSAPFVKRPTRSSSSPTARRSTKSSRNSNILRAKN